MMTVGLRKVPIAKLRLPGDWRAKMNDPGVPAMAESQKLLGIIHDPVVRESDWKLFAGCTRVAGALYNGEEEILCKLVECTDEEGELITLTENLYRRHASPGPETQELVRKLAERVTILRLERGKETIVEPGRKKGRLKLPKTVAREIVAQATGKTKEAQRKSEQRFRKKQETLIAQHDHDADLGIASPWAEIDDTFRRQTNQVVKATHDISQLLSRAVGGITALVDSGNPVHQARLNRLKEEVALCSRTMRGMVPSSLCPYCKGVEEVQNGIPDVRKPCGGCMGTGYITKNQEEGVPKELWEKEPAIVMVNGKPEPFESFFQREPETDMTMVTDEDPFLGMGE